jgi:hypothetical protein
MSRYYQIKISSEHTEKQKEFFETFPFHKPFTKYDYTFNKYQKGDQDWLTENACSPKHQHLSSTFQIVKEFIEANILGLSRIVCIPRNTYRQIKIKVITPNSIKMFHTRAIVL